MSLAVINAHTGEQHQPPASTHSSLDAFKSWLEGDTSVVAKDQILLTSFGKQAKLQALKSEVRSPLEQARRMLTINQQQQIYLYNRQLISSSSTAPPPKLARSRRVIAKPRPPLPSDTVTSPDDLQAWRRLFLTQRDWARDILRLSEPLIRELFRQNDASAHIHAGLAVAVGSLQSHVRSLDNKYNEASDWARRSSRDQDDVMHGARLSSSRMASLPADRDFLPLLPALEHYRGGSNTSRSAASGTLNSFADPEDIADASATIHTARQSVTDRLIPLEKSVKDINHDRDALLEASERIGRDVEDNNTRAATELMEEIEVLVNKLSADSEHIAGLQQSQKAVTQTTKMAHSHSNQYLPSLLEYYDELAQKVQKATEDHDDIAQESLKTMQSIARIEAALSQTNSQLMKLDVSEEAETAFQYLNVVTQLPFVYGALMVEAVRRHEWPARLKAESSDLMEDIAGYREEEERRRKRWLKNIGHLIDQAAADEKVSGAELSFRSEEAQIWPKVSRQDVADYIAAMRELDGVDEIVEELSESLKDLDRPTKRQVKRSKGSFKNGSIHEAMNMTGSFSLRTSDELRTLRDSNSRLEDDLKAQKSRVRKLEDLLYQQQQRPKSANIFESAASGRVNSMTPDFEQPSSPLTERPRSRKDERARRPSTAAEDKQFARRITNLEAELEEEKRKRQKEARASAGEASAMKARFEESQSTQKDLMENMEAQQREFVTERHLLQDETRDHKAKIDELEDELEEANKTISEMEGEREEQGAAIQTVRVELGAETEAPASLAELLHELEELAARSTRQASELKQNLASAKVDKEVLQDTIDQQAKEVENQQARGGTLEEQLSTVRSDLDAETAKAASLDAELQDAREQLKSLRSKFGDGETGSEALKSRLQEQAARAGSLAVELAESKSHVNSLDFELSSLQRRHNKLQNDASATMKRLVNRTNRDRDLTQTLIGVQDELMRLLETLGLSMFWHNGSLAIQRTSKLLSGSTSGLTESSPTPNIASTVELRPTPASQHWMEAETAEDETELYSELSSKLSALSISTFSEAMIKLRRDVEWTGKKWKQEARNYKDKFQRTQTEAYGKIAFRSFKEGDLALFLPTRNQVATKPWAAFNIAAPHYFLREQDAHKLSNRDWLVARISKIEERVVDLSRSLTVNKSHDTMAKDKDAASIKSTAGESAISFDDDNPFELSDGLRWYLLDATEERLGAPTAPGLGKSTVASANVDAKGSVQRTTKSAAAHSNQGVIKMLNKSLDTDTKSRRGSTTSSKRASIASIPKEAAQSLREAASSGSIKPRPGTGSSAAAVPAPTSDGTFAGAGLAGMARSPSSQSQDKKPPAQDKERDHEQQQLQGRPVPAPRQSAKDALLQVASSSSPSKPSLLGMFGTSVSPPKSSWLKRSPTRDRAGFGGVQRQASSSPYTIASPAEPARPRGPSRSPTKERVVMQDAPGASSESRASPAKQTQSQSASVSVSRSMTASPAKRPGGASRTTSQKQGAAWESLWSLEFGAEEGRQSR